MNSFSQFHLIWSYLSLKIQGNQIFCRDLWPSLFWSLSHFSNLTLRLPNLCEVQKDIAHSLRCLVLNLSSVKYSPVLYFIYSSFHTHLNILNFAYVYLMDFFSLWWPNTQLHPTFLLSSFCAKGSSPGKDTHKSVLMKQCTQ